MNTTDRRDDPIDIERFFALIVSYHEGLSETLRAMDPALRDWLVAAGCIDEEMAAAASSWLDESIEADEDGEEIVRQELVVGTGVEVPVDEASETDHFFFRAEEGKTYLIETVWEGLSSIRIELTDGRTFWKVRERNRQPLQFTWTASEPGQYRLNVTSRSSLEGGTGSYILGVSFGDQTAMPAAPATPAPAAARVASPAPMPTAGPAASPEPTVTPAPAEAALSAPADVRYAFEGTAIRINWETVEGADYYNLYHDDFFDSSCSLREDGSPSFCEELAVDVVDTTYLHTDPNAAKNYYWVVACNQEGCSQIDSGTPAVPIVGRPVSPPAVTFAREGAAIRISWDFVEGADYYKVYHDAFFGSGCSLGPDGRPSFCQELATNVVEPGYVHTAPGEDRNFYWVVACNRGGCSEIVSEDPAREG